MVFFILNFKDYFYHLNVNNSSQILSKSKTNNRTPSLSKTNRRNALKKFANPRSKYTNQPGKELNHTEYADPRG